MLSKHACMYVCMYVRRYVCMHACMHVYAHPGVDRHGFQSLGVAIKLPSCAMFYVVCLEKASLNFELQTRRFYLLHECCDMCIYTSIYAHRGRQREKEREREGENTESRVQ